MSAGAPESGERGTSRLRRLLTVAGGGSLFTGAVSWAACLLLAWIFVGVLVDPVQPSKLFARGWAILGAALLLGVVVVLARTTSRPVAWLEEHSRVRRGIGLVLLVVSGWVMLRLGMAVRFAPGWDAGAAESWAHGLAHGSNDREAFELLMNRYPNNLTLTSGLTRWFQLCEALGISSLGMGVVVANVLALGLSLLLTWTVARRVGGATAGYVAVGLALPLVVVSPWLGTAYSDTLGMIFPIALIWLFLVAKDARRWWQQGLCWIAVGLVGHVGYLLKPTVVFTIIAVFAGLVVAVVAERRLRLGVRSVAVALVATLVGAAAASVVLSLVVDPLRIGPQEDEKELAIPVTHFLMMGAQQQGEYSWGGWLGADVALTESVPTDERFDHSLEVYLDRVRGWGAGGYLNFLDEKANWIYGDGNFFAFGEGRMNRPQPRWEFGDPTSAALREWMVPQYDDYRWVAQARQTTWLAVLGLVVVPAFWWRRGVHALPTAVMRVALLGLTVFLLFFEARARYLYLYLPLFLVLASVSAVHLARLLPRGAEGPTPVAAEPESV